VRFFRESPSSWYPTFYPSIYSPGESHPHDEGLPSLFFLGRARTVRRVQFPPSVYLSKPFLFPLWKRGAFVFPFPWPISLFFFLAFGIAVLSPLSLHPIIVKGRPSFFSPTPWSPPCPGSALFFPLRSFPLRSSLRRRSYVVFFMSSFRGRSFLRLKRFPPEISNRLFRKVPH